MGRWMSLTRLFAAIIASLLLLASPAAAQIQAPYYIGSETQLDALSVSLRGLMVVSTDASSGTDCDFSSTTGDYLSICLWCDGTSAWVTPGACASVGDKLLMETGDFVLMETGDKILLE